MRLVLRFFAIVLGLWILRRAGVTPVIAPAAAGAAATTVTVPSDVAHIVNLMTTEPAIGLVFQTNRPGEQLQAARFDGPGGRA